MSWFVRLRSYLGHDEEPIIIQDGREEAARVRNNAWAALGEARQRRDEIHEVTTSLAALRAQNHFGESIELAMRPKEKRS